MKKIIPSFLLAILFFNTHAFCQVIFSGDFNNKIIVGNGEANTWAEYAPSSPVKHDHRWKLDSTYVRQGRYSLRVEVRPGDTSSTTSDRAELAGMYDSAGKRLRITKESMTEYMAFSVRLDSGWKAPSKTGIDTLEDIYHGIIFQLKKTNSPDSGTGPAFALQATNRIYVTQHTGNVKNPKDTVYELLKNGLNRGSWIDFVIKIKYSIHGSGKLTVWRRNQDECCFSLVLNVEKVNTLFYEIKGGKRESLLHEWHTGYYRSKQLQDETGVTNILWLDGFTIAKTAAEVQFNAFDSVIVDLPGDYNKNINLLSVNKLTNTVNNNYRNDNLLLVHDIYPNQFSVSLKDNSLISGIAIYNAAGEIIMQKKTNGTIVNVQKNEIGNTAGVYFIEVISDNKIYRGKIRFL